MPDYFIVVAPEKRPYPVEELNSLVKFGKLKIYGPYPQTTLLEYYREGRVKDDTIIYCDDGQPTRPFLAIYTELLANLPPDSPAALAGQGLAEAPTTSARRRKRIALIAVLAVASLTTMYHFYRHSTTSIYNRTRAAVVRVTACDFSGKCDRSGSGFYIAAETIVTDAHLLDHAARIALTDSAGATVTDYGVLGFDRSGELAYLRAAPSNQWLTIRDLGGTVPDDRVYLLTPQADQEQALAEGTIGALRRLADGSHAARLQLSSALSGDDCGSPIIDTRGEAVGIVTSPENFPPDALTRNVATVEPFTATPDALTAYRLPLSAERFEPYYVTQRSAEEWDYLTETPAYKTIETTWLVNAGAINRFADDSYNLWVRSSRRTIVNGSPSPQADDGPAAALVNYAVDCGSFKAKPLTICTTAPANGGKANYACGKAKSALALGGRAAESLCEYLHALPPELD